MTSERFSLPTSAPSQSRLGRSDAISPDSADLPWLYSARKPSIWRDLREIFVDEFWAYRGLVQAHPARHPRALQAEDHGIRRGRC